MLLLLRQRRLLMLDVGVGVILGRHHVVLKAVGGQAMRRRAVGLFIFVVVVAATVEV